MTAPGTFRSPTLSSLSGIEKVAVLLLALGKSKASGILRRLDSEELKQLSRSASTLRPVAAGDVEALVEEFAQNFSSGVKFMGTESEIRDLLSEVMTDQEYAEAVSGATSEPMTVDILAQTEPERDTQIWEKIAKVKMEILRAYLLAEHPQTVGLILSKLDSEAAAKTISSFPPEVRSGVLVRMLAVNAVDDEALQSIETTLAEDLLAVAAPTSHGGVADILNRLEKTQTEEVLRNLAQVRPDDAKALKNMLFSFEDMITLTPQARTLVLDQVPIEKLVLALKGADGTFQSTILASLAARSRRMVEAELQGGGAGSPKEVNEARRAMVDTVLRMASRGEIQIRPPDELSDVTA